MTGYIKFGVFQPLDSYSGDSGGINGLAPARAWEWMADPATGGMTAFDTEAEAIEWAAQNAAGKVTWVEEVKLERIVAHDDGSTWARH